VLCNGTFANVFFQNKGPSPQKFHDKCLEELLEFLCHISNLVSKYETVHSHPLFGSRQVRSVTHSDSWASCCLYVLHEFYGQTESAVNQTLHAILWIFAYSALQIVFL